jgi:hypothetical protein
MRRIAPQQYRIAVQQRQAVLLMGMAAMRSERRFPARRQFSFVFQRVIGDFGFPWRGSTQNGERSDKCLGSILRRGKLEPFGAPNVVRLERRRGAAKKEAARRRPESREETPKEGMCSKHRTSNILAPNRINARTQC